MFSRKVYVFGFCTKIELTGQLCFYRITSEMKIFGNVTFF